MFLEIDLHGYPNYDVTPTFTDVTAYAIYESGYLLYHPCIYPYIF